MATNSNPFTGSGWSGGPNPSNFMPGGILWGSPQPGGAPGLQPPGNVNAPAPSSAGPSGPFTAPTFSAPNTGAFGNPGGLEDWNSNIKDMARNTGLLNVEQEQMRMGLIPQFANEMFATATPAANFDFNLMSNENSPFYQALNALGVNQGVLQNRNAFATAAEELAPRTYGSQPGSPGGGMIAALLGAMNQGGAQNLSDIYLQNIIRNMGLRTQGSQQLAALAAMFNPSSLFGYGQNPGSTQGPNAIDNIAKIMGMFSATPTGTGITIGSGGVPH